MKHQKTRLLIKVIRTCGFLFFPGLLCFFLLAMTTKRMAGDLWQQLGITQVQANQHINSSFTFGQLSYLGVKNAKNIAAGDRVAVINELVAYARKYIAGDEFKKA